MHAQIGIITLANSKYKLDPYTLTLDNLSLDSYKLR
jgi:hypothetical protein